MQELSMNTYRAVFPCAAIAIVLFAKAALADTLNVPANIDTIQAAINAAEDGDKVVIAPGSYQEAIDLLGKAITVRRSGGPKVTIITAGIGNTAVFCDSKEDSGTVLQDLTVAKSGGGPFPEEQEAMLILCSHLTMQNRQFVENGTVDKQVVH